MIWLYILGGILLLVVLILLVKVSFYASYCGKTPYVAVKIAWFTIPIVDGSIEEKLAAKPAAQKPKEKKKKKKKPVPEKPVTGEPPTISELAKLAKALLADLYEGVKRGFRLEELRARVLVATDDAADTAIRYGAVCGMLAPVQAFADAVPKRKKNEKKVRIEPECDFLACETELDLRLGFSFRIGNALMIAIRSAKDALALLDAIKRKKNSKKGSV